MKGIGRRMWWCVVLVGICPSPAEAQGPPQANKTINVFFDCQTMGCRDLDFFRREVPVVNWVRDREVADVHVLVTSEATGGGGRLYTLAFIGQRGFAGESQELTRAVAGDATEDDRRQAVSLALRLGLVRYLQGTAAAEQITVSFGAALQPGEAGPPGAPGAEGQTAPEDDPWNYWVFRIGADGFINGESTSRFSNYFGSASANRTTETWKFNLGGDFRQNVQEFDIPQEDGSTRTVKETRKDWGVDVLLVRSISGQWSAGVRANAGSSTFLNQDFRWSLKPGLEYNFFSYEESSRRSLTLQYLVGPQHWNYTEETIYGRTEETRYQQSLTGRLALVQPWGRWSTSVTGAHYLHDTSRYSVTVFGSINVRLFRGFSVRMTGNYSWIRDQLFISAVGATEEEILLRQRQLETSFRYFTSFGIEYRFGSIFNNVVNPRFGGGGGGGEFFFF